MGDLRRFDGFLKYGSNRRKKSEIIKGFITNTISTQNRSFKKKERMKSKRTRKIGISLCWISIALWLLLAAFFYFILNENFIQHNVQRSVLKMDNEMRMLIDKGLNHDELEKSQTGLTVFMNDTLVFWNRNDVNPKLMKRKVKIGHDTICTMVFGDYYVK